MKNKYYFLFFYMSEQYDIDSLLFGILSADNIKAMSVCEINSPKLIGSNTVYDERMGYNPENEKEPCITCGLKKDCVGHFGHINLNEPILHPLLYKHITMYLKCFCTQCYRLLLLDEQLELFGFNKIKGEKRINKIMEKIEKTKLCPHCKSECPKIIFKTKDMNIIMEYPEKDKKKISILLYVDDIKKIFDNIKREDIFSLGIDPDNIHPKDMIITVLPVSPPCARPCVFADGNKCDDDITYQLIEIIKSNNKLETCEEKDREKNIQSLKFRIATMFDNSKGKAKHPTTNNRPLKGFKERLVGKDGRARQNLMGKRVDFSARTVIGADPTLKLGHLGIPKEIAKIHSIPEVVTSFNIDWLTYLVNNDKANSISTIVDGVVKTRNLNYAMFRKGTELLHGDIIVRGNWEPKYDKKGNVKTPKETAFLKIINIQSGNEPIHKRDRIIRNGKVIEYEEPQKKNITLKLGDTVHRQLIKGDYVLFNRQPTLHKGSMLATRIVPMDCKSFKFNLAATKSFNADFDGDEMNIHTPQCQESIAELKYISSTNLNIITAQESKPVIVITQDALVASYLMTKKDFKLTRTQFFDISTRCETWDEKPLYNAERIKRMEKLLKKRGKNSNVFSGRGLFSLLFPETLNYRKKNNAKEDEPVVIIENGVLIEGAMDKSILGNDHGSLIQILNKEYGVQVVSNFIDNVQFLGNAWLLVHGFSVGLEDCMITSEKSVSIIDDTITQCYTKAEGIEETTRNEGIREIRITAALSQARDIGMKISKEAMRMENNFLTTVSSGAKGDFFNIAQITSLLGQQNLEGKRVAHTISHKKRTLPHYPFGKLPKEREYESRGFIRNSFIHGLTPEEFFFHAMSGREGVADTAMGTARSGYIQRKIVKVGEDLCVKYDGTVRDAGNKIIQFVYGSDGFDPTKTIRVQSEPAPCDIERLADRLNTAFECGIDDQPLQLISIPEVKTTIQKTDDKLKQKNILIEKIKKIQPGSICDSSWSVKELSQKLESLNKKEEEVEYESGEEDEDESENEEDENTEDSEEEFIEEFFEDSEPEDAGGDDYEEPDFKDE
jgi:DNA-directed RNA polymerase beta' subunit